MLPTMIKKIGTHNGTFHCDEVMAIAMLLRIHPSKNDMRIVRSRNADLLAACDIVVDVGGVYDHSRGRYDHHQPEFKDTFSPDFKTPLSSAGLIYKYLTLANEMLFFYFFSNTDIMGGK